MECHDRETKAPGQTYVDTVKKRKKMEMKDTRTHGKPNIFAYNPQNG